MEKYDREIEGCDNVVQKEYQWTVMICTRIGLQLSWSEENRFFVTLPGGV